MNRYLSVMMDLGHYLVSYDKYIQSFSLLLPNQSNTDNEKGSILSRDPRYRRSESLPQWMKDYFDWHNEQTKGMNETNLNENKYLILRCTKKESQCGGLSDRLKSVPFFIAAAARTKRVFLIRWDRPAKLEEFLLPNEVNWSVPDWMVDKIDGRNISSQMRRNGLALIKTYKQEQSTVLEGLLQEIHGGSALYYEVQAELDNSTDLDANIGGNPGWSMYENIFHDLFRSLFQPSEPIARLLKRKMEMTNLTAGQCVSCHHRAFYAVEDQKHKRETQQLRNQALNAVNCASMIMPGAPIYFASDSKESLQAAREVAVRDHRPIVTTHEDEEEALHLDRADNWTALDPSKFYPTFVDLLLMGNARCTAYGVGGFGRFGALLSYNSTCIIRHVKRPKSETCHWTDTVTTTQMANIQ